MSKKAILITWDDDNCRPDDLIQVIQDIEKSNHTIIMDFVDNPKNMDIRK